MATDWLEIQKAYAIKRLTVGFWGREGGKKKQKSKASAKVGLVDRAKALEITECLVTSSP